MQVYIISYLPDDTKLRQTRLRYHIRQLNWLRNWYHTLYITVCAQNYQSHELQTQLVDQYIQKPKLSPAIARNVLLEQFYKSDEDWCLFLDDDSILVENERNSDNRLFPKEYDDLSFADIDCFQTIDPSRWPIKQLNTHGQLTDWWKFKATDGLKTSFWFLRNLNKAYSQPVYFDETMTHGEDGEFAIQLISKGFSLYTLQNLTLRELGKDNSTLDGAEFEDRNDANNDVRKYLESKYASLGYSYDKRKLFINKHWPKDKHRIKLLAKRVQKSTYGQIFA